MSIVMEICGLFPTAIGVFNLNRKLTDQELDCIVSLDTIKNKNNFTSCDNFVFNNHSVLKELYGFCIDSAKHYFKEVCSPSNKELELYITQSWCNYTKPGQSHHPHTHPNSILSGVFYVSAKENVDRIYFSNDSHKYINIEIDNYNLYNSESWWLPVTTGKLLIFPSHLRHSVNTTESQEERISLSFNTFVRGEIGSKTKLTFLQL